jgi:di/tricarboxylate transporter
MTPQIAIVLALLVIAVVLFATERIPIEIVALLLVIALVLTNTLSAPEAFAGFGNDIVVTISGLFIQTGGLAKTGVIDEVGRRLHRTAGDSEFRITALIIFSAALCAAIMKNTTTTAMFLPVVLGMATRTGMDIRSLRAHRLV